MKFILLMLCVPFLFVSCFVSVFSSDDTDGTGEETVEDTDDTDENAEEEETVPEEITEVDITSDIFISNFFSASYDYKGVSIFSTYDYMVRQLGEPEESGQIVDGTYYSYGPIAFNYPVEAAGDTQDAQVDGIIIFPEEFYKLDAVENYGWPTFDEPGNFRMFYDGDAENGFYTMLTYDRDDRITAVTLHNKNLQDTDFYEE